MKHFWIILIAAALCACSQQNNSSKPTVTLHPHEEFTGDVKGYTSVFLAGTIDMGKAERWQDEAERLFAEKPGSFLLYNPRQAEWHPEIEGEMDYQVNWELEHLESADWILMNFLPGSQSPITLLELGLHAKSGKLIVICTPGYFRYDNVRITCGRYGVPVYSSLETAIEAIR